jgi:hypothetical protein
MLSRLSYLTVNKMTVPEEREDEKDSTDDESLASASTALTAPPCERLLVKDLSDIHRIDSRNIQ